LSKLVPLGRQLTLFEADERLHASVDDLRARYGFDVLRRALGAKNQR